MFQLRGHLVGEAVRDVGVLAGVGGRRLDRHLGEGNLLGALAAKIGVFDGRHPEILLRQVVHPVAPAAREQEVGGEHGVEQGAANLIAGLFEHRDVVFDVLADFLDLGRFQKR